ncbi:MAG TPA: hypothetical protein VF755_00790 [Catenuloplanes sp.]|jgi:hypothetical protein
MARPLLMPYSSRFLDEVLDYLGRDVDVEVAFTPTAAQWATAPMVLLDARAWAQVNRLPDHRWPVAIVGSDQSGTQVAALVERWRCVSPGTTLYQWPHGADAVRRLVAEALTAPRRLDVRIAVIGGHGGAGASTLAVALAQAACHAGRRTVLVDSDPLGGGIAARVGHGAALRIVEQHEVAEQPGGLADVVGLSPAEVTVVDLSRALDAGQLSAAARCDLVLVVTDAGHNAAATRRVLTTLTGAGAAVAVVGRSETDHTADYVASDFSAPRAGDVPPAGRAVVRAGAVDVVTDGALFAFATEVLAEVPKLVIEAAR